MTATGTELPVPDEAVETFRRLSSQVVPLAEMPLSQRVAAVASPVVAAELRRQADDAWCSCGDDDGCGFRVTATDLRRRADELDPRA